MGPYVVEDVLGEGPHGIVYAAVRGDRTRRWALKRMKLPVAGERLSDEFMRIAQVTVQLAHPGICNLAHMFLHGRRVTMAFEMLPGRSLAQLLAERGALKPGEVVGLARQICIALQYAHQRNVYHTALHPANVFLLNDGSVMLTDTAIAALYGLSVGAKPNYTAARATFLAPEFLAEGIIHPPSDIYSLGMVLRCALTGEMPGGGGVGDTAANRFAYLEVGGVSTAGRSGSGVPDLPAGTPESLRHVITSATERDPADRPESVRAVLATLQGARSAPIGARVADEAEKSADEGPPAGSRLRVCPACRRPVSPAGRVCLACGLVLRPPEEADEPVNYFHQHGRRLLAENRLREAEKAYLRAIERDPGQSALYNELGDVLAVGNHFEEAVKYYRRALRLDPDDDDAWHDLGLSLAALRRRREARKALERAAELTERDEVRLSARIHLGALAAAEGRLDEAVSLWTQVLAEEPGLSAVRMALASTYASQKMYREAEEQLRNVLAAEPGNRQADNLLARVRARAELEREDVDESYGLIDDVGGAEGFLGVGFNWARWL
ncbi:MAG: tetratricopeptide repeat protein [Armatimonadetes bacterium]|nr:tetratricopeptide repeat protein [Armatimonadota bacterium]